MSVTKSVLYSLLRKRIKVHYRDGLNYLDLRKTNKPLRKFTNKNQVLLRVNDRDVLEIKGDKNTDKIIIFLHGGGYVGGSDGLHVSLNQKLVRETGCTSYILDYRLAPENGYLEAHEDVDGLYKYVQKNHPQKDIIIIGDSAGGGLTLAYTMSLISKGETPSKQLVLISPWLDVSGTNELMTEEIDLIDPILSKKGLIEAGKMYCKDLDNKHYLVSPLFGSLDNLPPVLMISSSDDIIQYDADAFYDRCVKEDKDINYLKYDGLPHDFVIVPFVFKESKEVINKIVRFITSGGNNHEE